MKSPGSGRRSPPRQSDIIIRPDGTVSVSFLWEDLRPLAAGSAGEDALPNNHAAQETPQIVRRGFLGRASRPSKCAPARKKRVQEEYRRCILCPRKCGFDRVNGTHPLCGDGNLKISTWGVSYGDEPEIRGEGGSGTVMLGGCPLRCPSCHNPEMVRGGTPVSMKMFHEIALSLESDGAENLQILSPTVHIPVIHRLLAGLKNISFGLPIVLKSSGYESVEQLKRLEGFVDIYIPDLKYGPGSKWADKAGAPEYFETACAAIEEMYRQTGPSVVDRRGVLKNGVLVRHVRAPLPRKERKAIDDFMAAMPEGIRRSVQERFDRVFSKTTAGPIYCPKAGPPPARPQGR